MIELHGVETLGIGTSPSKAAMAKVETDLLAPHAEYQAHLLRSSGPGAAAPAFELTNTIAPVAGASVVIDVAASGDPEALAADLRVLGAGKVTVFGHFVSGRVPITPTLYGDSYMKRIQFVATIRALIQMGAAILALSPGLLQAQLNTIGHWETRPEAMSVNPIHVGLLRTGKVLVIAGSGNVPNVTVYKAAVWNPETGTIADQNIPWDHFCNGMSFLPDGRALIVSGSKPYPTNVFKGLKNTTIFDPETSIFHRVEDMTDGRWYPTNVSLPDGRTATFSGYGEDGTRNATAEIYTPGSGWSPEYANGWPASLGNYPRAHLTPHGDLFFSGAQLDSHRFDPITLTWNKNVARTTHGATRRYGSSVLLGLRPPLYTARILIAGGGATAATDSTEIIDLGVSTPQWQPTGSLNFKRVEHNAVLLPNGKILAIGGSNTNNKIDDNGEGRFSEMYDPETGDWTIMDQQAYWRLYHSTALLLPDGRVASLGSNPQQGTYDQHIEIYSPPYLFADNGDLANRPIGNHCAGHRSTMRRRPSR